MLRVWSLQMALSWWCFFLPIHVPLLLLSVEEFREITKSAHWCPMTFRRKGCFSSHQTNRLAKPWTLLGGLTLKNVASWTSRLPARKHVVQLPIICDRKVSTPETLWHHHIPQGHFPAMSTDISRAMDSLQFPTSCSRTPFEEIMLKCVMNYLPSLPILAIL